jgi:acyl phosphate:glycerol-3-phosphate acyltransferase
MEFLAYLAAGAFGYLLGSIPFGLVIVKAAGLGDIRAIGSGNIGATNVLRTGRKELALATLLLDSGKAAIALLVAKWAFGQALWGNAGLGAQCGFIAGAAAFLGHCFPVWLKFQGGKGVATFFGVLFAGLPLVGLASGAIWILTAVLFRFSSLGSLMAAGLAPVVAFALKEGAWGVGFCALLAALIFWRHKANIERLLSGQEPKIGAKSKSAETNEA